MKYKFIFIVTLLFFGLLSCKKTPTPTYSKGDQLFGWARGKKNGLDWEASAYCLYHPNDSSFVGMYFQTFDESYWLIEDLILGEIPIAKAGTYDIEHGHDKKGDGKVGSSLSINEGDVTQGTYKAGKKGQLVIEKIDTINHKISGKFSANFKDGTADGWPKKIEVEDIEFELWFHQ